ncbi:GyrI-like domain-containing protein [Methanobacterium ferruginis]|uniref:GyrI-like domain-containing protein n=1 Tax=Methanobacterium ferruginis TaxID=710191 RepID=UPI00257357C1|nr:GyrI-like domain-containing protein [Methanobacterium ferruginis]BDZ66748.1 hypothetical protein GCM10025860_01960 [Methanobacterium ferruginis]
MEIIEKKLEKRQIAYITYKGSYQEITGLIGEIVGFLIAKGILTTKGVQWMGPPFCVYFNSPHEVPVEDLMYEVGMPFAGEAEEKGRVKIKITPEQLVLSTVRKGSYSECAVAYGEIAKYAYQNGYEIVGPPMETYISDPHETPENELLTEISFPVKRNMSS